MKTQDKKERRCANCRTVIDKTKMYGILTEVVPLVFEFTGKEEHEVSYLCTKHYQEIAYIAQ